MATLHPPHRLVGDVDTYVARAGMEADFCAQPQDLALPAEFGLTDRSVSSSTTAAAFALQQQHLLPMPTQPPAVQPLDTSALLLRAHQDAEVKLNGRAPNGTLPPQRRAWQGLQAPLGQQPPFTAYARHAPPSSAWPQRAAATEPLCFAAEPISQTLDGLLAMPLHRSNGA